MQCSDKCSRTEHQIFINQYFSELIAVIVQKMSKVTQGVQAKKQDERAEKVLHTSSQRKMCDVHQRKHDWI